MIRNFSGAGDNTGGGRAVTESMRANGALRNEEIHLMSILPTVSRPMRAIAAGVAAAGLSAAAVTGVLTAPAHAASNPTPRGVAECTNGDLHAGFRATDAGAGNRFGRLVLTNTSSGVCYVRGFGGLSYVGDGDGTQIGAAATRTPSKVRTVVLQPGEKAVSRVDASVAENYSKKQCRPTKVDGFRVYVPDSRASQFVKYTTTGCRNAKIHLLAHTSYRKVQAS